MEQIFSDVDLVHSELASHQPRSRLEVVREATLAYLRLLAQQDEQDETKKKTSRRLEERDVTYLRAQLLEWTNAAIDTENARRLIAMGKGAPQLAASEDLTSTQIAMVLVHQGLVVCALQPVDEDASKREQLPHCVLSVKDTSTGTWSSSAHDVRVLLRRYDYGITTNKIAKVMSMMQEMLLEHEALMEHSEQQQRVS